MTRYHHVVGLLDYLVYKEKGQKVLGVCRRIARTTTVCSFQFQLWLGVSKLIARTCHLCVVFHCQVVISTNSSIPELLLCYG